MKLSVIVPAFKVAPFIYECLISILAQNTSFDFEVIVCNDASPDSTMDIVRYLQPYYSNLVVLDNKENLGLVKTMGRLLEAARGEYIAYLDGDDIALPGKLQTQVDYLDKNISCRIVYHESDMFDHETGKKLKLYSRDFYNAKYIPQQADITHLIRYTVFLQASSVMVRRYPRMQEALDHGNHIICDFPWHIMNLGLGNGTVDRIDQVLGRYRVHQSSFGGQTKNNHTRRIEVTKELVNACELGKRFGVTEPCIQLGINHVYFSAALYFLKLDENALFTQMIEQSITNQQYFDERHQMAYEQRHQPEKVKNALGWSA